MTKNTYFKIIVKFLFQIFNLHISDLLAILLSIIIRKLTFVKFTVYFAYKIYFLYNLLKLIKKFNKFVFQNSNALQ